MDTKNKYSSQMIHKRCNNHHKNLYYTNKNVNHDKYARDGKKLRKRKKHQTKGKQSLLTDKETQTCLIKKKTIIKKQDPKLLPSNVWWGGHFYSQLFFTDHDFQSFWCREDEATIIKPNDCHSIKIKSKISISFSDPKPEHDILWSGFWTRDGYIDSNNWYDQFKPIKQVSNIEQCDITLSSSYSYNHFPKRKIHKSFNINTIPFSRGLGCGGMVHNYHDVLIVLNKCIEQIVSNYKQDYFDLSLFKLQSKYIRWIIDPVNYNSKYFQCMGLVKCLKDMNIPENLADIIVGYIDYDRIIQIQVTGQLFCWCDQKRYIDMNKKKELVKFVTPHEESIIQNYFLCFLCDVNGMNKRVFDNFVIQESNY